MAKTKLYHVCLSGDVLYVSEKPLDRPGRTWRVRSITPKAAARKLIRGGTIAEAIAKREREWDNPFQRQREDSLAKDRVSPRTKRMVAAVRIEVVRNQN